MRFRTEINPITGALEEFFWDDQDKKMTIRATEDVTNIIESNKRQQNSQVAADSRYGPEMMHHVADIPMAIVEKWKREEGLDVFSSEPSMRKRLIAKLNDPDWRYLKSTGKRL